MSGLQIRSEQDSLGRSPGAVSSSVSAPGLQSVCCLQQRPQAEARKDPEQTRVDGDLLQPSSACSSGHRLSLSGPSSKSAPSSNAHPVYRMVPTGEAAASVSCDLLTASPACDIPAVQWDREGMGEFGGGRHRS